MAKLHNPNGVPPTYSDGVEVASGGRTLYIAGQVGFAADKSVPTGIAEQTRLLFKNLEAVLKSADMGLENIVKMTVFIVEPSDFDEFRSVRTQIMGANRPASTLVYVKQLIVPELLVEIEAIAIAK
jgi:2-iminobutanoate/2-iminopropanoate deaminase